MEMRSRSGWLLGVVVVGGWMVGWSEVKFVGRRKKKGLLDGWICWLGR